MAALLFGCVGLYVVHGGIQVHVHPAVLPLLRAEGLAPYALSYSILADIQSIGSFPKRHASYPTAFPHAYPPVPLVRVCPMLTPFEDGFSRRGEARGT